MISYALKCMKMILKKILKINMTRQGKFRIRITSLRMYSITGK